ncbi:thioesterase [Deltaproteobacteria bacterium]|nr:thioesterase [Deltaproteobacteria bacterium]
MKQPENATIDAVWHEHRVSYGETDAMGIVYYAEYLHFFERARSSFIREKGMSYAEVEKRGVYLPVREASCRYRSPSRFDDIIHIRVWVSEWGRASITFSYELFGDDKEKLRAAGKTQHAIVDQAGRPFAVPDWFRNLFP